MWKEPAVPRHVVQTIPVDESGDMLVMHRGANVRSAPNCWSFPSGLHDIGESAYNAAARELFEEYGLVANKLLPCGVYENIPGDGYHWVISLYAARVGNVRHAKNMEPDKHDDMHFIPAWRLLDPIFWVDYTFHISFHNWMAINRGWVVHRLNEVLIG